MNIKDSDLYINVDGKNVKLDAETIDAIYNLHEKNRIMDDLKNQVNAESKIAGFYTEGDFNDIADFYLNYKENSRSEMEQLSELIKDKDDAIRGEMFVTVSIDKDFKENTGEVPWADEDYVVGSGQAYVARDTEGIRTKAFAFDIDFALGEDSNIVLLQAETDILHREFGIEMDDGDIESNLFDKICFALNGREYNDILDEIREGNGLDEVCESAESRSDDGKLSASVKEWYMEKYPSDDVGPELSDKTTFSDVVNGLQNHDDIYDVLGFGDSLVRERVFSELSDRLNTDYDNIYDAWIGKNDLDLGKDMSDDAR